MLLRNSISFVSDDCLQSVTHRTNEILQSVQRNWSPRIPKTCFLYSAVNKWNFLLSETSPLKLVTQESPYRLWTPWELFSLQTSFKFSRAVTSPMFAFAHRRLVNVQTSNSAFFIFAVLVVWFSYSRPYKMFYTVKFFTIIFAVLLI